MMEMNLCFMIQNVKVENEIYKIDEIVRIIDRSSLNEIMYAIT